MLLPTAGITKPTPPQPMPKDLPSRLVLVTKKKFQPFHYDLRQDKLTGINKPEKTFLLRLRTDLSDDLPPKIVETVSDGSVTYRPIIGNSASPEGYLVFYRDNRLRDLRPEKTKYLARMLTADGAERWRVSLNAHMISGSSEIQDVRLRNGILYVNESCRNLRSFGPKCSTIVALEPQQNKVLWRTPAHVSTNLFIFLEEGFLLSAFGDSPDNSAAYLIDADTGRPVSRTPIDGTMMYAEQQQGYLHLFTLDTHYIYRVGDGSKPEGPVVGASEEPSDDDGTDPLETNEADPDEADEDLADEHDGLGVESDDHGLMDDVETLRPAEDSTIRSGRRGASERRGK